MTDPDLIVAFLNARYDEDEEAARWSAEHMPAAHQTDPNSERFNPDRVLKEVESKRKILDETIPIVEELDEIAYGEGQGSVPYGEPVAHLLKLLALPFSDHEDYPALVGTVTS